MHHEVTIRTAARSDLDGILQLLAANDLPLDGVADWLDRFHVAVRDGRLVGAAGTELHGGHALLRSVVVDAASRGLGIGEHLVDAILTELRQSQVHSVYLLTTTADHYFPRFGFSLTERATVPEALHASEEFAHACPATARVMVRMVGVS
jgi:amino-acid N-acetyltransferase